MTRIRKIVFVEERVLAEAGQAAGTPISRVAGIAVIANPFAGQGHVADLSPLFEIGGKLGEAIMPDVVRRLENPATSYGKAAIVGVNGDFEQGGALIHPKLGKPMRAALGGGEAIISSNVKVAPAGTAIDVPLAQAGSAAARHSSAAHHRNDDAAEIPGRPRAAAARQRRRRRRDQVARAWQINPQGSTPWRRPSRPRPIGKPVALLRPLSVRKLVALLRPLPARERAAILVHAIHEGTLTRVWADQVLFALALDDNPVTRAALRLVPTTSAAQRQRHP